MARQRASQIVRDDRTVCGPTASDLPGGGTVRRNRIRLVGETTMNLRNGSTSAPPNGVAQGMGDLTHDIVSLAELQFELFRNDCREGMKGLLVPVVLLLVAGIVALGTVPIALLLVAEILIQVAGLSRASALSIAALSGLIGAVVLGVVGWSQLRGVGRVFQRSREEWIRNLNWIKLALKRSPPIESQHVDDG